MKDARTVLEVLVAMPIVTYAAWWLFPWALAIYKISERAAQRWANARTDIPQIPDPKGE